MGEPRARGAVQQGTQFDRSDVTHVAAYQDDPHSRKRKSPKPRPLIHGNKDQRWSTMARVLGHQARLPDRPRRPAPRSNRYLLQWVADCLQKMTSDDEHINLV